MQSGGGLSELSSDTFRFHEGLEILRPQKFQRQGCYLCPIIVVTLNFEWLNYRGIAEILKIVVAVDFFIFGWKMPRKSDGVQILAVDSRMFY